MNVVVMSILQATYRAHNSFDQTRTGNLIARTATPMQLTPEELKAHLMETDEGFRRLAMQHCDFKKQLEALSSRSYLSPQEQVEETRLKKQKLKLKDQMQEIMDRYRHEQQMV